MEEIWKDIPEFDGYYQGSNLGRIKSLYYRKERILKQQENKQGYTKVVLCKNGVQKNYSVHRLIWMAFHGEIPDNMEINHINCQRNDNKLENLELVSHRENLNWGNGNKLRADKTSKKVLQYSMDGELIKEWSSTREVERQLGFNHTNIGACCLGKYKSGYGFVWRY